MIENKIDELIAAIDRLTAALGQQATATPAPAPAPKVEPTEAPAPKAPSAADKIADMENRCRALARKDPKMMRTAILDLLEAYGSKTIKNVPEDKLDELSAKLAELEG